MKVILDISPHLINKLTLSISILHQHNFGVIKRTNNRVKKCTNKQESSEQSLRKERNQFRDAFERGRQDLVDALEDCNEKSKVIEHLQETNIKQEHTIKLVESETTNLIQI